MPLITQEKPKLVGANGAGWGGGGGWGGRIEGGMVGGKGGQRPRDCVPIAWQNGEVFFKKKAYEKTYVFPPFKVFDVRFHVDDDFFILSFYVLGV